MNGPPSTMDSRRNCRRAAALWAVSVGQARAVARPRDFRGRVSVHAFRSHGGGLTHAADITRARLAALAATPLGIDFVARLFALCRDHGVRAADRGPPTKNCRRHTDPHGDPACWASHPLRYRFSASAMKRMSTCASLASREIFSACPLGRAFCSDGMRPMEQRLPRLFGSSLHGLFSGLG